ncbi:MAG: hypothetical protein H6667_17420 [Ardenticatenaceae bacterium]|nr:hypothetical protein [Ardenticatenaceae bacterium]MCB9443234.1 hypothetical protein [Ardenticatenaceae bacterium]
MSEARKHKRLGTVLNAAIPLLLTIVGVWLVLELGLRHFYQLIPLEVCASDSILGNYYCQPYFEYDKPVRLAYHYKPNLKLEGYWDPANPYLGDAGPETRPSDRSEPFWFVLETDEMGFPNAQDEWQDNYDIVITGDSFTIRTVPTTWIERLAANTGRSILTLGAPSWTTLNEVEAVKQFGLDKHPDWVLLMYFEGNDLINAQQYLDKQASGLSWREYDMQGVPWYRKLVTYHLARYLLTRPNQESDEPPVYRYPVVASTEVGPIDVVLKDIHLLPLSADYETIVHSDEYAAIMGAIKELDGLTKAQGTRLLVVYIPSKEHVVWSRIWDETDVNNILARTVTVMLSGGDHGRLQWQPQYLSYETFNANHDDQMVALEQFTADNGIEFLNLTPMLWEETIKLGEVYQYGDPHWNQVGNDLVADAIQRYIEAAEGN